VALVLIDTSLRAAGMNHFLLPRPVTNAALLRDPAALFGMAAMDLLINEMMRLGSTRASLKAKVFGGASLFPLPGLPMGKVAQSNIDFAFDYLDREGIPVLVSDVGGTQPRKIWLFPESGQVLLSRLGSKIHPGLSYREGRYRKSLSERDEGDVLIFGGGEKP